MGLNFPIAGLKTTEKRENSIPISFLMIALERKVIGVFLFSLIIPLSMPIGPTWSRIYFFDFSLFALYFLWIARLSQDDKWIIKLYIMDGLLIILLFWLFVCNVLGLRPGLSFERWFLWLRGFLIYLYFSRKLGKVIDIKSFLKLLMFLVIVEGGLSIFQMITQSNFGQINQYFGTYKPEKVAGFWYHGEKIIRPSGTFFNTGILTEWMVLLLPILLSFFFYKKKDTLKKYILISWFIGIIGALCTLSRSELACIMLGTVFVLYWHRVIRLSGKISKKLLHFTIIFVVLLIGIGFASYNSGYLEKGLHRISDFEGRFEKKLAYMESAIQIMEMKPLLGVGQGNFGLLLEETDFPFYHHGEGVVHNIPLLIGSESGYIGFLLFIVVILYVTIKCLKEMRSKPSNLHQAVTGGALIGIICIVFDMQWSAGLIHHSLLPLFFVILGIAFSRQSLYQRE